MPRAANRFGISREVTAAKICQDFRNVLPLLFPHPEAEIHITPAFYKDQTLTVKVDTPAWAQEVVMRKHKIIEEMNKKAGEEIIKKLKTELK